MLNHRNYGYTPRPAHDPHVGVAYRAAAPHRYLTDATIIDQRAMAPRYRDQGGQGACTGFASRGALLGLIEAARADGVWSEAPFDVSPGALYSEALFAEGTLGLDVGATLARLVSVMSDRGIPREDRAPYDERAFTRRAPPGAWTSHRLVSATPLRHDLGEIRAAMADGCIVLVGIPCYDGPHGIAAESTYLSGSIAMPRTSDALTGWHAMALFGHDPTDTRDDDEGVFFPQQSWRGWADANNGLGTIPTAYVIRLANEIIALGAVR